MERGIDVLAEQEFESDRECGLDDWVQESPIDDTFIKARGEAVNELHRRRKR